jgi:hypothetical protein
MFERSDNIPLIKPFLLNVQPQNNKVVNNAINDLLIEEEDYKTLRDSVENYDNYDPVELAQRLEKHEYVSIQSSDHFCPCAKDLPWWQTRFLPAGGSQHLPKAQAMEPIHRAVKTRQAFQRRHRNCRRIGQ